MATQELGTQKLFGFVLPAGSDGELIKQTIIAILTALFLLTIFILFVFPRVADLAAANKKVAGLEEGRNNLVKTLDALDGFKQGVSESAKESVYLAIPTKFDPGYILLSLRKLAGENQVGLVNYTLAGGEVEGTVEKKSIGVVRPHVVKAEISGTPLNLINFVDSLDNYLPVVSVSDLSISEVSKVLISGSAESRLTMTLTYYHLPIAPVPSQSLAGKYLSQKDLDSIRALVDYKRLTSFSTSTATPSGAGKDNLFGL